LKEGKKGGGGLQKKEKRSYVIGKRKRKVKDEKGGRKMSRGKAKYGN